MSAPGYIQRQRTKGWKMPEGVVYCGRPTRWGNPFRIHLGSDIIYGDASHRRKILSPWIHIEVINPKEAHARILELHKEWLAAGPEGNRWYIRPAPSVEEIKKELAGKHLSCWCRDVNCCHVNELLKIANT